MDIIEEPKKKYDNKLYYEKFKNKHEVNEKHICDICYGTYSYFNKSNHNKSKRHERALNIIEQKNKVIE
jgi:hypothetical protein